MRYTDQKIMEALKAPRIVNEVNNGQQNQYTANLSISDDVYIELINAPKDVYIDSHSNIPITYELEPVWDRLGIKEVLLTVTHVGTFTVDYSVYEEGMTEAEINEEEINETTISPVTVSFTKLPCNIYEEFGWRLVLDYTNNKLIRIEHD